MPAEILRSPNVYLLRRDVFMNKLTKSSTDKILSGVCGGIAEFFGIESLIVRLIFIFLPASLFIYVILVFLLPEDKNLY